MEALNKEVSKVVLLLIDGDWNGGGDESGGESGREGDQDRDEDGVHDEAKPSFPPSGDPSTTLPTLGPILSESVAGFGGAQGGDADAIAAAVPVVGGFNAAPVAVGFGATPVAVGTVPVTIQETAPEPDIEYSEALFPDHLIMADYTQLEYSRFCNESIQARAIHDWVFSQHLWHLIRINPGLVRLTTPSRLGFIGVSTELICATLASLTNLKELDICRLHSMPGIWALRNHLPAGLESLSMFIEAFPLPDSLPEVDSNLLSLSARGKTTINGLLTLLGIFPNLESLGSFFIEVSAESPLHPNLSPSSPPLPLGGHSLRRLKANLRDWDALLRCLPGVVEWDVGRALDGNLASLLMKRCPEIESFGGDNRPWYVEDVGSNEEGTTSRFLVASRHLRVIDSIYNFIRVDGALRQPWACMGLEWLTCRIVGVDRLTPEEEGVVARITMPRFSVELSAEETMAVEKFRRYRAQHHGIYYRLSSLNRLKRLDLGYETWPSKLVHQPLFAGCH
ncbi:hypothetical protein BGX23_002623 [Mortierella sp. AD031]|nr:hypothetical protein BGX23_002623 [Mortierella sp. AD031]